MSSDLFIFDGSSCSLYQNSSPEEILSSETEFFMGDQEFSPFSDSAIDIFQALSDHNQTTSTNQQNPLQKTDSHQLQQFQALNLQTTSDFPNGFGDSHVSDSVKTEQSFDATAFYYNNNSSDFGSVFSPHSHTDSGVENVAKLIQRSLSANCFEQKPCSSGFLLTPRFDHLSESQTLQSQALSWSENGFLRKVCSTGDLQSFGTVRTTQRSQSSPLASESSLVVEETNFKVGKYSAEERKERISKYRAKRTLRNFNKTIKYACRKTLADNRPRIRGRFARNDEPAGFDIPKAPSSLSSRPDGDDDDDFLLEGLNEEEEGIDETVRAQFVNSYGPTQFQYYGF